jgi:hypothetical protein
MRNSRCVLLWLALLVVPSAAMAQTASPPATSGNDRSFLNFAEEAALVDGQWWEGRAEYSAADEFDSLLARGIVALQFWNDIEVGGSVGFGSTDASDGAPDGSGATDLDGWAKYRFNTGTKTDWAAGGVVTVPTGDDTAGLGFDAFALELFGSMRHRLSRMILNGNAGFRVSDDGSTRGLPDQDGEISPVLGFGVLAPLSDKVDAVGELRYEGERFEDFDDDARLLGGVNWRTSARGRLRAAATVGLSDGAPDFQVFAGYAALF